MFLYRLLRFLEGLLPTVPPDYCLKHKVFFERGGECPVCEDDH